MTRIDYGRCSECNGLIYVDVTTYNMGYRCRQCKIYSEEALIKSGTNIRDMNKGAKLVGNKK